MRGLFLAALATLGLMAGAAQASWFSSYKAVEAEARAKMQADLVEFYKQCGYRYGFQFPVDANGNVQRLNYIPHYFGPMQWTVPGNAIQGPPFAYPVPPYGAFGTPPMGAPLPPYGAFGVTPH